MDLWIILYRWSLWLLCLFVFTPTLCAESGRPMAFRGRVLGVGGKPLAGARVAAMPELGQDDVDLAEILSTRSSRDGRFSIRVPDKNWRIGIWAAGYLPDFATFRPGETPELQEFRLSVGGMPYQVVLATPEGRRIVRGALTVSRLCPGSYQQFLVDLRRDKVEIKLPEGTYHFHAESGGLIGTARIRVPQDPSPLHLVLRRREASPPLAVRAWVRKEAIPIKGCRAEGSMEDLQPLKKLVGSVRVVGLGEATHGSREFFQMKHRLFRFLVEEMGFRILAIEAPMAEAQWVNRFILSGNGDPRRAARALRIPAWGTEEMASLIQWMRQYNSDPRNTEKLRFYGVDTEGEATPLFQAKGWLLREAPEERVHLDALHHRWLGLPRYFQGPVLTENQAAWRVIAEGLDAMWGRLEARKPVAGAGAWEVHCQDIRLLSQWARSESDLWNARDEAMAANVAWILKTEPGAKVMLWAHNGHVKTDTPPYMGWHLRQALGQDYLSIGLIFREGGFLAMSRGRGLGRCQVPVHPRGTLGEALASFGSPMLALDLRQLPATGPVPAWFEGLQGFWSIGASFSKMTADRYLEVMAVRGAFDGLVFVDRTTPTHRIGTDGPWARHPEQNQSQTATGKGQGSGITGQPSLPGWELDSGSHFLVTREAGPPLGEGGCLRFTYTGERDPSEWCFMEQTLQAAPYRGKRIHVVCRARTDGTGDVSVELAGQVVDGRGLLLPLQDRPIASQDWTELQVEGVVPEDAKSISLQLEVHGAGSAWVEDLRILTDPGSPD